MFPQPACLSANISHGVNHGIAGERAILCEQLARSIVTMMRGADAVHDGVASSGKKIIFVSIVWTDPFPDDAKMENLSRQILFTTNADTPAVNASTPKF